MKIIDSGMVFKGETDTNYAYSHIPSVEYVSDDSLLVSYRNGPDKMSAEGKIQVSKSKDLGKTWDEPIQPFNSEYKGAKGLIWSAYLREIEHSRIISAMLWIDVNKYHGKPHFNTETLGIAPVKTLLSESTDNGKTWSICRELDNVPFQTPLPVENGIFRLADNGLIAFFDKYKNYDDPSPWKQAAVVRMSYDNGKSWLHYSVCAEDTDRRFWYTDQRGIVLEDGRILIFYYTYDTQKKEYINIHYNISKDNGKTWSIPKDAGIPGQASQPVELNDGRIILAAVDREKTNTIYAAINHEKDDMNWSDCSKVIIYSKSDSNHTKNSTDENKNFADWFDYDFGRPQAILLPDNTVMVVYYAGTKKETGIYYARIGVLS